ncbi:GNAT family N-acetyltransferase [Streptomyces sp. NPDC001793]|uniref:GNAT family N-acetyltransferase n=1 Tax=Streptomyces sp. NPDC001793 TaxID=3154657 RepID=UPI00332D46EE
MAGPAVPQAACADARSLTGAARPAARAWANRRSGVDVHPAHRGRGLGAALPDWAEARARRAGSEGIVQTVPDEDAAAGALVRSCGYLSAAPQVLRGVGPAHRRPARLRPRPVAGGVRRRPTRGRGHGGRGGPSRRHRFSAPGAGPSPGARCRRRGGWGTGT